MQSASSTIAVCVDDHFSIGAAFEDATRKYNERLANATAGKEVSSISLSHSTGFILGQGYHCTIIATIIYS